ncbi:membrane-bound alkaline phosphatase isoform X1 [Spodoptera frugiperda]|uniref:Alkaline phosphatase n=1 Tax=Spodoptera frugiperda TaxID=7108 RepID=A0A9R0D7I9_SPOFR|nr:membrane-bound alkaline phosphatase isoform X1 [Spodoptera frugiperda]
MRSLLTYLVAAVVVAACVRGDRYHPADPGSRADTVVNRAETSANYWAQEAQAAINARLAHKESVKKARNVVMFLGDGMSVPTLAAARTLLGQRRGHTGEEDKLHFETFPTVGLTKTYCVNAQIPDSACTATAYLCGVKTTYGAIGVNAEVPRKGCEASTDTSRHVESIAEWALADGRDAGIVTTTRITHASPAGVYAKVADRNWEHNQAVENDGFDTDKCPDIALQLVHKHPGNKLKVILGGGRLNFLPNDVKDEEGVYGNRTDTRNLIEEWAQDKEDRKVTHKYVWNREQLMSLKDDLPEYLLGLFESNHLQYNMQADPNTEPTLTELTEIAIKSLSRNEKGFFLFVEGGRIDHAHHRNWVELALDETLEMDKAVARAAELLSEDDSLIVVTADHSHVMAYNGYSARGHDILGPSRDLDLDGVPYMTLSYTNGPGFRSHMNGIRPDVTAEDDFREDEWLAHVDVPLIDETHGGDDVAVFARGPHHSMFTGLYEQSQLPHLMAYAACIGPGRHACSGAAHALAQPVLLLSLLVLLTSLFQQ